MAPTYVALLIGILIGGATAFFYMSLRVSKNLVPKSESETAKQRAELAERSLEGERATAKHLDGRVQKLESDLRSAEAGKLEAMQSVSALNSDILNLRALVSQSKGDIDIIQGQYTAALEANSQFQIFDATSKANEKAALDSKLRLENDLGELKRIHQEECNRANQLHSDCVKLQSELLGANERLDTQRSYCEKLQNEIDALKPARDEEVHRANQLQNENIGLGTELRSANEKVESHKGDTERVRKEVDSLKLDIQGESNRANQLHRENVRLIEELRGANERLDAQKFEIERIQKEFNTGFENIANRLLEEKSAKFVQTNKDSIEALLKPLGDNLTAFQSKVDAVYDKESKERFSLGKEVGRLFELNQILSKEANNLVSALKGNSKTQGDWGQMILENILERSGLTKGRDYLVQEFLKDADGNYVKTEENRKLQPDVVINYPDDRKVLIDAKASLTAYVKHTEAESEEEKALALTEHMRSIRKHIDELASKSYQDYTGGASLDFILMFVPSEPAYCCAMAEDPELWYYAYAKKVLLINPTNLIIVLKMTAEIWRRENQARNHQEIAKRGSSLYEKFVGFVATLKDIGSNLKSADTAYQKALNQLADGNGNLVKQAEMLKDLGVKARKTLPSDLLERAGAGEIAVLHEVEQKTISVAAIDSEPADLFSAGSADRIKIAEGS